MSWLKQLWRGELSLSNTFWLFGVFGAFLLLPLLVFVLSKPLGLVFPYMDIYAMNEPAGAAIFIAWIVYYIFALVAIWRSAGNYQGKKVWAILARIYVGVYSFGLAIQLPLWIDQILS